MEDHQHSLSPLENLSSDNQKEEQVYDLVEEVEKITGYRFNNLDLVEQVFTDPSFKRNCKSYQRPEFFGDSVLNYLVSEELYFLYPDLHPGKLTHLRAANVNTEKLARVAVKHDLYKYLRHKKGLLAGQIVEFKEAILEYPLHSYGLIETPKFLADIVESLIGAMHIDSNLSWDTTRQVVKNLLQPMITPETLEMNPVAKLHEWCHRAGLKLQIEDLHWKQNGVIEIYIDKKFAGRGKYCSKKLIAINRAADSAYKQITKKISAFESVDNDKNDS